MASPFSTHFRHTIAPPESQKIRHDPAALRAVGKQKKTCPNLVYGGSGGPRLAGRLLAGKNLPPGGWGQVFLTPHTHICGIPRIPVPPCISTMRPGNAQRLHQANQQLDVPRLSRGNMNAHFFFKKGCYYGGRNATAWWKTSTKVALPAETPPPPKLDWLLVHGNPPPRGAANPQAGVIVD